MNDRRAGILLGTAVGDALGLPAEGLSPQRRRRMLPGPWRHRLLFGRGLVSDDTEHTFFVAQSLLEHPNDAASFQRRLAGRLRWWLASLPAGIGMATAWACLKLWLGFAPTRSEVFSAGNGPAMRSALLGGCFRDRPDALESFVRASTQITHTDPQGNGRGTRRCTRGRMGRRAPSTVRTSTCNRPTGMSSSTGAPSPGVRQVDQVQDNTLLLPVPAAVADGFGGRKRLVEWLRVAMTVLQSAASSTDFFDRAARATVEIAGLDCGRVLLREGEDWRVQSRYLAPHMSNFGEEPPSRRILATVYREKRALWQLPDPVRLTASLVGVTAVVAAPILDPRGAVVGIIYGDRRQLTGAASGPVITELEAILVEVLACGLAAGLARLEQERAALTARVQFEQFFTPELARQLAADPDLLEGRDAEITVLFCDLCGFSRISERLGPTTTVQWVRDVMDGLSNCVRRHGGVLVDYIGDELMAMWGAPRSQPDHAAAACRAALDMLDALSGLNHRWQPVLGEPMDLGIGVNTGVARVGNTGSQYKFKYGPLGNTVNLASRIQGATRHLHCRLLISGATRAQLDADARARRLCRARLTNIAEPVDLFELAAAARPEWPDLTHQYEAALDRWEQAESSEAARILRGVLPLHPADGPSQALLSRATAALASPGDRFDPVWTFPGK